MAIRVAIWCQLWFWALWNLANILRYINESQISAGSCNNVEQQTYHWDTKFANAVENLSSGKHGGFLNRIRQNKQTIKPMQLQSLISESCWGLGQSVHISHKNLCKILRFCGAILKSTFKPGHCTTFKVIFSEGQLIFIVLHQNIKILLTVSRYYDLLTSCTMHWSSAMG